MFNDAQEFQKKPFSLYQGDCLELMKSIPDASVDMVLCDLPYGTTACKWDVVIPFDKLWEQYRRVVKPNAAIVLFGSEPFSSHMRLSNLRAYRYDWTWDKVTARGHLVAKKRPMQQTECVSVFSEQPHRYFPIMIPRPADKIERRGKTEYARTEIMGGMQRAVSTDKVYDTWYPKTLLKFSNAGSSVKSVHPTQKPVGLCEYLIRTYTNEGETVLDNCMGSGTTGVACANTGRKFIGMEQDAGYFKIASERIEQAFQKGVEQVLERRGESADLFAGTLA
ncbi:DNA-methyltransferase [Streptomyces erythrochromogenes]